MENTHWISKTSYERKIKDLVNIFLCGLHVEKIVMEVDDKQVNK